MTAPQQQPAPWGRPLPQRALPWLVLLIGLLLTSLFSESQRRFRQLEHERVERYLAADITKAIQTRMRTNLAILDALVGLFDASEQVTEREFADFFRALGLHQETLQGIQGIGYAAIVPGDGVQAFEQRMRNQGQPDFRLHPAGRRPRMTAIVFLEPNDWRNARAIGFDMYSEPMRRQAMQRAALTGEASLSAPVRLVQETDVSPQIGTLLYAPIYSDPGSALRSAQERQRRLRGWAYAPMRMGDLINSALAGINNPDKVGTGVLIYDGDRPRADRLLYDNLNLAGSDRLSHPTWLEVQIANRTWLIGIQLDHTHLHPLGWSQTLLLSTLLGLSLSVLAALLTQRLVANHLALQQALTQQVQAARERALAATVFDTSPVGIVVTDADGIVLRVNQAFTRISGYSELEARGHKANLLRSGRHDDDFYRSLWEAIVQRGHWSGEIWNRHRNGQIRRHDLNITAVFDAQQQIVSFVGLLQDVTERYGQQQKMRRLATHDQLTGLANRRLLEEELECSLALARREGHGVGLLFVDLDGFKAVNDSCGHSSGDALLQAVARRLRHNRRGSDLLCRRGGDEFVLLIPIASSLEPLRALALKLHRSLQEPYPELPPGLQVGASIGVARWPDHAEDGQGLIDAADQAMYAAKQLGDQPHIAIAGCALPASLPQRPAPQANQLLDPSGAARVADPDPRAPGVA